MDHSDQFITYSIFNGKDALLRWARVQGKMNNIVIVTKRSDYGGEGKRRPRVILAYERSGNYKSCKSSETTDIRVSSRSFIWGRLSEEENALLVDMSKSLVKSRDILVTLKDRDAMNVSTMKTIYNARI
ncbi:uncharacterized protein LOC117630298 [Prunus dulcis]|uniref:uncharacterized protein LOC117630298 n=1 Tax=Prunus dulcis TaxID=3755 RepID=UPI0014833A92|nr:uncharacterized protein LOC117630298 [Prunus dulcis]